MAERLVSVWHTAPAGMQLRWPPLLSLLRTNSKHDVIENGMWTAVKTIYTLTTLHI